MSALTAQAIQDAALALVEEHGADKLTMRRLADRLGVEAPSLYHHVPSKSALLDRVLDAVVSRAPPPPVGVEWDLHLRLVARDWRTLFGAHPHALELVGSRPSRGLFILARHAETTDLLVASGFSPDQATDLLRSLFVLVLGHAEVGQAGERGPGHEAWLDRAVEALIRGWGAARGGEATVGADADPGGDDLHASAGPGGDEAAQDADLGQALDSGTADGPASEETSSLAPGGEQAEAGATSTTAEEPPAARPAAAPSGPPPTPRPRPAPAPSHRPEEPRRGGLASRILRRAGHLLGGDED